MPAPEARTHLLLVAADHSERADCEAWLRDAHDLAGADRALEVHALATGEEAVALAARLCEAGEPVSGALVDLALPGDLDGIETALQLWEIDPRLQCTTVTGDDGSIERAIGRRVPEERLDRWDHVARPLHRFGIVQRVRRMLSGWYAQRREERSAAENEALERALRDLERAQGQLLHQEKLASIGQLAAGVAHELNNPIGFVHSNLGTLKRYSERIVRMIEAYRARVGGSDEELQALETELKIGFILEDLPALVEESLEGTERVRKIVTDLRGFSRPADQKPRHADLNEALRSTLNIVHNEVKYRAQVVTDLGAIPEVRCQVGHINQVFMNMLVNAAHAIEKSGEIRVATRHEGDCVVVTFADTGCGIPPDVLPRIFDPFFTTKEVGRGTGLGLSISFDIVRKHGGRIEVDSAVGRGTTFTIRLPVDGSPELDA